MNLTDFGISQTRGFLPDQDPLLLLPSKFLPLDELASMLPKLLMTTKTRHVIESLPFLPTFELTEKAQIERAMMNYSFIGHSYAFCDPKNVASELPDTIAQPWFALSEQLGRPPVLSYASYALHNWRRIDPNGPIACGNISLLTNFWGGADEEWFILIHIDIEMKAAPAIAILPALVEGIETKDYVKVEAGLKTMCASLRAMNETMDRMPEFCDPHIYYRRVRPFIHGWKNNPALPNGMIYKGVSAYSGPQMFRGETGAQSGIIPLFDAVLGVAHADDPLRQYLLEMRLYMPKEHRAYLEWAESKPTIRSILDSSSSAIKDLYNLAVAEIDTFRTTHLTFAAQYIANQASAGAANSNAVGTGGTPFMKYLTKHRDETRTHKV